MPTEIETERREKLAENIATITANVKSMEGKIDSTETKVEKLLRHFEGKDNIFTTMKLNGRMAKPHCSALRLPLFA